MFAGKRLFWSLFLIKLQAGSNTDGFCEYGKIFKDNYFEENLRTVVSVKAPFLDWEQVFLTY